MKPTAVRTLTYCSLFVALIAVCSWISVPVTPPFTLQVLPVFLCGALLGWKRGLCSVACYLALGALGVPVFSNFTGGFAKLAGPTGGYLIGFLFTVTIVGLFAQKGKRKTVPTLIGMLLGMLAYYAFGTAWYFFAFVSQTGLAGLGTAVMQCVLPFLPFDLLKLAVALLLTRRLDRFVQV